MLEGIEILNKTEIMITPHYIDTLKVIFSVMLGICAVCVAICLANKKYRKSLGENDYEAIDHTFISSVVVGIISLVLIIAISVGEDDLKQPSGQYTYEVTIDKEVNFEEFYEKYEIIDQRGKIYIIRER